MRGFGIAGCGCCSESCEHSRGLRTFRRLWSTSLAQRLHGRRSERGRFQSRGWAASFPGAKAPTLGCVGMPRLKPGPISEATTKEEAHSSAALRNNKPRQRQNQKQRQRQKPMRGFFAALRMTTQFSALRMTSKAEANTEILASPE